MNRAFLIRSDGPCDLWSTVTIYQNLMVLEILCDKMIKEVSSDEREEDFSIITGRKIVSEISSIYEAERGTVQAFIYTLVSDNAQNGMWYSINRVHIHARDVTIDRVAFVNSRKSL